MFRWKKQLQELKKSSGKFKRIKYQPQATRKKICRLFFTNQKKFLCEHGDIPIFLYASIVMH